MLVAGICRIEVGIGKPVFKSETLACLLEIFLASLKNNIHISIRISLPSFALVCPSKNTGTLLIAGTRNIFSELLTRILRELCEVSDTIERKLVTSLDTTQVKTCVMHRLIYITSFACARALLKCGKQTDSHMHSGVGIAQRRAGLSRNIIVAFPPSCRGCRAGCDLRYRFVSFQVFIA